jgi:hypothetical protein
MDAHIARASFIIGKPTIFFSSHKDGYGENKNKSHQCMVWFYVHPFSENFELSQTHVSRRYIDQILSREAKFKWRCSNTIFENQ